VVTKISLTTDKLKPENKEKPVVVNKIFKKIFPQPVKKPVLGCFFSFFATEMETRIKWQNAQGLMRNAKRNELQL